MNAKNKLLPEDVFLNDIKKLIKNLLIDNSNYKNNYYFNCSDTFNTLNLIKDTKERANYILRKIDDWKHLVKDVK